MPEATPMRRACWRRKVSADATRNPPPSNGPRPNRSETKKPEASSELHNKENKAFVRFNNQSNAMATTFNLKLHCFTCNHV